MRVSLLVTDHAEGGTPLRFARLARGLQERGAEVQYGCLAAAGPLTERLAAEGIETFAAGARGPGDLRAIARLRDAWCAWRPDLVHAALFHSNLVARWLGRRLRLPVVTTTATIERERRWHLPLERLTAGWDCGRIVNSRTLAEHVIHDLGAPPGRVWVTSPSVAMPALRPRDDVRRALDLPAGVFAVLWAGRVDPVKRVEFILAAAQRMRGQGVWFGIVGDGPDRGRLERLADALRLQDTVRFLGWRRDWTSLLPAADAFAFPSLTEGMPNAVLEAMAAGVPVIASDRPAHRELRGDGPARLLLMRVDSPDGLVQGIKTLRCNPAETAEMAARAAEWARSACDPGVAVDQTLAAYRQVLAGNASK
jgi:glycosyltransferase involved in cell wall biosynthesis